MLQPNYFELSWVIELHWITLHCIALYYIVLHCLALHCIVLKFHCSRLPGSCLQDWDYILFCIVLYCIAFCCIVLHCIALYRIVSCGIFCYPTPLYGIACYCVVGFGARAVSCKTPICFILFLVEKIVKKRDIPPWSSFHSFPSTAPNNIAAHRGPGCLP